jgi:hypothetical protein
MTAVKSFIVQTPYRLALEQNIKVIEKLKILTKLSVFYNLALNYLFTFSASIPGLRFNRNCHENKIKIKIKLNCRQLQKF